MAKGSSSTKKAAQLAQQRPGARTGSRFQGGVFPIAMVLVIVIGIGLIYYARASRPDPQAGNPELTDHWHAVYGIKICDTWYQLSGRLDEEVADNAPLAGYRANGIHSHDDGVIHWHANSGRATGDNATLGVFLENYGVELTNTELNIGEDTSLFPVVDSTDDEDSGDETADTSVPTSTPSTDPAASTTAPDSADTSEPEVPTVEFEEPIYGPDKWDEDEYTCDGESVKITMLEWDYFEDVEPTRELSASLEDVRIDTDGMVLGIYIVPDGAEREMPPWAADLPELASRENPTEDYQVGQSGGIYEVTTATTAATETASTEPDSIEADSIETGTSSPSSSPSTSEG